MCELDSESLQNIIDRLVDNGIENQIKELIYCHKHAKFQLSIIISSIDVQKISIEHSQEKIVDLLRTNCGYSGSYWNFSHIGNTYAVLAVKIILNHDLTKESEDIMKYLLKLKTNEGNFRNYENGEIDMRATYCAVACATFTNNITEDFADNIAIYIKKCQNEDGGFGGTIGEESHLGYTFCALGALALLNEVPNDINGLSFWLFSRIQKYGINGRPDKLVDSCYSYWLIGSIVLLSYYANSIYQFNFDSVNKYLLYCCQSCCQSYNSDNDIIGPSNGIGGFADKPGDKPDWYHTLYSLSSLSILQNFYNLYYETDTKEQLNEICPLLNIPLSIAKKIGEHNNNQYLTNFYNWYDETKKIYKNLKNNAKIIL